MYIYLYTYTYVYEYVYILHIHIQTYTHGMYMSSGHTHECVMRLYSGQEESETREYRTKTHRTHKSI